ncbi:helix-turn-helix transcriptional regulator [Paenibacillus sp. strain BS8-2]
MKLDRLLAITLELMAQKRVRAADLASRFEVSTRTIYREIELINQAGIPVVSYTGADGGFELMDGFFLTKQHFTVRDFAVIYRLLQSVEGAVGDRFTTMKDKLRSLHPGLADGEGTDELLFHLSTAEFERELVRQAYRAIGAKRVIAFDYISATGKKTARRLEPTRLFWDHGSWYVEGYCLTRSAKRMFRVSRMSELRVTEETFAERELADGESEDPEEAPLGIPAHLRFHKSADPRVSEQFRGECSREGEHIDVRTVFFNEDYALSVVLSYGAKVVVVEPEELKSALIRRLEEIRRLYER